MEFSVNMHKLIKGVFDLDILNQNVYGNLTDYDKDMIQGSRKDAIEFYHYVEQFKKDNPEFKDINDVTFIRTANFHNDNLCVQDYLFNLYIEIEEKLIDIFDILNDFGSMENDLFMIRVDGSAIFEGLISPTNLAMFSGENSFNKLTTIVMAAETLCPEILNEYNDNERFYDISLLAEEYSREKLRLLENHFKSLRNLKELELFEPMMRIDIFPEDFIREEWNYEFTKDELRVIIEATRNYKDK